MAVAEGLGEGGDVDFAIETDVVGEALADPDGEAPIADGTGVFADEGVGNFVGGVVGESPGRGDGSAVGAEEAVGIDIGLAKEDVVGDGVIVDAAGAVVPEEGEAEAPGGVGDEDAVGGGGVLERGAGEAQFDFGEDGTGRGRLEGAIGIKVKAARLEVVGVEGLGIKEESEGEEKEREEEGEAAIASRMRSSVRGFPRIRFHKGQNMVFLSHC